MKKALATVTLATAVSLLAGCAVSGPTYRTFWFKEGVSYDEAVTIEAECQYKIGMAKLDNPFNTHNMVQSCMKMQGFRWKTQLVNGKG